MRRKESFFLNLIHLHRLWKKHWNKKDILHNFSKTISKVSSRPLALKKYVHERIINRLSGPLNGITESPTCFVWRVAKKADTFPRVTAKMQGNSRTLWFTCQEISWFSTTDIWIKRWKVFFFPPKRKDIYITILCRIICHPLTYSHTKFLCLISPPWDKTSK